MGVQEPSDLVHDPCAANMIDAARLQILSPEKVPCCSGDVTAADSQPCKAIASTGKEQVSRSAKA